MNQTLNDCRSELKNYPKYTTDSSPKSKLAADTDYTVYSLSYRVDGYYAIAPSNPLPTAVGAGTCVKSLFSRDEATL